MPVIHLKIFGGGASLFIFRQHEVEQNLSALLALLVPIISVLASIAWLSRKVPLPTVPPGRKFIPYPEHCIVL